MVKLFLTALLSAQIAQGQACTPEQARQIVRSAVNRELSAVSPQRRWMYDAEERRIESSDGILVRTLMRNGTPLSLSESASEKQGLQDLVNNPSALQKKRKEMQADFSRMNSILNTLPDAAQFTCGNKESNSQDFPFEPNTQYQPSSVEGKLANAMSGVVRVDVQQNRLENINGTLKNNLLFGWGVLGRINQGSFVEIERSKINPTAWETTHFSLNIQGYVLIVKTIDQKADEARSNYVSVPGPLSANRALAVLFDEHPNQ